MAEETEAITVEQLQAKAEAKRQEAVGVGADSSTKNEPGEDPFKLVTVDITCPVCGARDRTSTLRAIASRVAGRFCDDCHQAHHKESMAQEQAIKQAERDAKVEERRGRIESLLQQSGANPWEHGRATLDNFDASETGQGPVDAVREFLAAARSAGHFDPVRGLYLFGDTGAGKSHLAVGTLRDLLLDPDWSTADAVFDHAIGLIARIQDTYKTGDSTSEILERRVRAKVWILDDLGSERASEDVVQRLTLIFTERAMRPTLVTSNDPPDRLEHRHPELKRVQSRLGPAYFRTVRVQGRDRRFDRSTAA